MPPWYPCDRLHKTMQAAIEAQWLMGHWEATCHMAVDRTTMVDGAWNVDQVRQQLHVPCNTLWNKQILAREAHGLADLTLYSAAATHAHPGWRDAPRAQWGTADSAACGVLRGGQGRGAPRQRHHASAVWEHGTDCRALPS